MSRPIVKTNYGYIRGVCKTTDIGKEYASFQGIPYVKQPVGKLRFRDPQPLEPWTGILDATKEGPRCTQLNTLAEPPVIEGDLNNCLHLNVYTPSLQPQKPLPVLVFIHGGGYYIGDNRTEIVGPDYLMERDVIFVSINYRLGIFGFLTLVDPAAGVPGNAGLKDMSMALRWVKENIAYFGGDPNNVTITGESAGGCAVQAQMFSDMSKHLFQKAICQSGSIFKFSHCQPHDQVAQFAYKLAYSLGYAGSKNDVELLKFFEAEDPTNIVAKSLTLIDPVELGQNHGHQVLLAFMPVIEPYQSEQCFFHKPLLEMGRDAWSKDIDVIFGACANEGILSMFSPNKEAIDKVLIEKPSAWLPFDIFELYKDPQDLAAKGDKIKRAYFGDKELTPGDIDKLDTYMTDSFMWHPYHRSVMQRLVGNGRGKTYMYRLDTPPCEANGFALKYRRIANVPADIKCTAHTDDLEYLFKTVYSRRVQPEDSCYLTQQRFLSVFTKFAKDGNPNDESFAPVKFEPVSFACPRLVLNMGEVEWKMIEYPPAEVIDAWNNIYPKNKLY